MAFVETEELASRALPSDAAVPHPYSRSFGPDGYHAALASERADQRLRGMADPSLVAPPPAPVVERDGSLTQADVGRLVDVMLGGALKRLDAEVEAARTESEARVAAAVRRVALVPPIRAWEGFSVERVGGILPTPGTAGPQVGERSSPALPAEEPDLVGQAGFAPVDLFGSESIGLRDSAEVYERFWADASEEHPLVGRLRRWARREVR